MFAYYRIFTNMLMTKYGYTLSFINQLSNISHNTISEYSHQTWQVTYHYDIYKWYWYWRAILGEFVASNLMLSLRCLACTNWWTSSKFAPLRFYRILNDCSTLYRSFWAYFWISKESYNITRVCHLWEYKSKSWNSIQYSTRRGSCAGL